ncbi:hypothetical protein BABINDRAFT_34358 [Babjeviella inositovora NRRL Y-12698]|uniref:ENTH domain-containing protein n=1 Tax=Babjeviella inositovora NRRL Y-12698 TaxID=984486 RepID=A0A1E3QW56_9ASCO|nr:uncharacterized protein BABINDRAFT_34358 [Babjeviella inositovora NRRL Y-12698]ODQ81322.1 hypothetical protein BABINDRAFT_34358 [Babjeviella inositovora NRRL Y-12698]
MSKSIVRTIKNVTNGYSLAQVTVRNATSNEASGPTRGEMFDIADLTYNNATFLETMDMLDRRLNDKGKNWRHIAKSLTVVEFTLLHGSENVVLWCKDNLYIIKTLREFTYIDGEGRDQGQLIRTKAKELTILLRDDDRIRAERAAARQEGRNRNAKPERRAQGRGEEYDLDLQAALEASRMTADEENRRMNDDDEEEAELRRAIQLSLEEDEMKRLKEQQQSANLLDLDSDAQPLFFQQPQYDAFGNVIQYDAFGNPVQAAMQTAYQQQLLQQQQQEAYQQQLQQQQEAYQQQLLQQQQEAYQQQLQQQQQQQQQQAYQQMLQQQQLQQQQQFQRPMLPVKTGTNNPFAFSSNNNSQSQYTQPEQAKPLAQTLTGNAKMNAQYSELNNLLAQGTGIDTFGNTGETRLPAQHTKTGTFVNSHGTGYRQEEASQNPFFGTQYTGISSTKVVPAYTGYGFGNDSSQRQGQQGQQGQQGGSLIDL